MARFQAVNLEKNQSVNLSKIDSNNVLEVLHVGLGWDVHDQVSADLDAFVVQLDAENREIDTLYFGSEKMNGKIYSKDRAIIHSGDNLTGEGEGDDEIINIHLNKLNPATKKLIVAVNIYMARLTFNQVDNAFVRLLNSKTEELLARYDLSQEFGDNYSMILGEIIKNEDGTWDFKAIGDGTKDRSIDSVRKNFSKGKAPDGTPKKKGLWGSLFG